MDKIREKNKWEGDKGQGEGGKNFLLECSGSNPMEREGKIRGKKEKKNKKKEKKRRGVRSSTFSLGLMENGPLVFFRARGKVLLRDESFS